MRTIVSGLVSVVATFVVASSIQGQVQGGVELDFANDFDFGVGARAVMPLESLNENVFVEGSFVYFFPSESAEELPGVSANVDYWELNGNVRIRIPMENPRFFPYVGTGVNIGRLSGDVSIAGVGETGQATTEIGLNLLGGVEFGDESTRPFAEARYQIGGGEQFIVAAGITLLIGS